MKTESNPTVNDQAAIVDAYDPLLALIRKRHSSRGEFNPDRSISKPILARILEAARWAPTPNNMQNFQIVVVDDPKTLTLIGALSAEMSEAYLKENYALLSASEAELRVRKIGTLAGIYPRAWVDPEAWNPTSDYRSQLTYLGKTLLQPKVLFVVLYDSSSRAPGSEGDTLGFMGLGCVMENMWLTAESLGLGMHILTVFADSPVEAEVRRVLKIEPQMKIAFACGLGYPAYPTVEDLRVRRDLDDFVHDNAFRQQNVSWSLELNKSLE
ncbi:nitroreductase family protein [Granulicella aggregans]